MPRALILLADGFPERHVLDVATALQAQGYETRTCGPERGVTYTGAAGGKVVADLGYLNVNMGAYALVIVPGGAAGDAIAAHKSLYNIVYSLLHKGRVVATIGTGVKALIAADGIKESPNPVETGTKVLEGAILRGRQVAVPEDLQEAVEKAGAHWKDLPLIVDGPVVTAQDVEGDLLARFVETAAPLARRQTLVRS